MRHGILVSAFAVAGIVGAASLTFGTVAAQSQLSDPAKAQTAGSAKTWTGRTAWGDPDLQGKWELAETATAMERPKDLANRAFLTDQETAARTEAFKKQSTPDDPDLAEVAFPQNKKVAPEHEKGIRGEEYNKFWVDSGAQKIKPWKRTSLIIDPPDGRMPPFTPEAIKRIEAREAARRGRGEADGWEDRNLSERCLLTAFERFGGGSTAAMSIRQIVQAPGWVAIVVSTLNANEPILIPLDGRPLPSDNVRTWFGVPRGRWEGTTLVIETTHINGKQDGGPVMPSRSPYQRFLGPGDTVRITERFTRVDAETIEYSYTIDDPKTYVRPYTVLRPLAKQDDNLLMPENGCHEGNYGIVGQLSAARADEAYAVKAAQGEASGRQGTLQEWKRKTEEWVKSRDKR